MIILNANVNFIKKIIYCWGKGFNVFFDSIVNDDGMPRFQCFPHRKMSLVEDMGVFTVFGMTIQPCKPIDPFHVYVNEVELEDKTITRSDV